MSKKAEFAPTDDGFTIVGQVRRFVVGPALIDDPDLGFSALKKYT